jgi:hypothetical protein
MNPPKNEGAADTLPRLSDRSWRYGHNLHKGGRW